MDDNQAWRTSGGALLNPITAELVRAVRDRADCSLMEAKRACILADGEIEAAHEILRLRVMQPITDARVTAHQLVRASVVYTADVGAAGERYIDALRRSGQAVALPPQFRWKDLWISMSRAARGLKGEPASSADLDGAHQLSRMPEYIYGREAEANEKVFTEGAMRAVWDRLQALERIVSATPGDADDVSAQTRRARP